MKAMDKTVKQTKRKCPNCEEKLIQIPYFPGSPQYKCPKCGTEWCDYDLRKCGK